MTLSCWVAGWVDDNKCARTLHYLTSRKAACKRTDSHGGLTTMLSIFDDSRDDHDFLSVCLATPKKFYTTWVVVSGIRFQIKISVQHRYNIDTRCTYQWPWYWWLATPCCSVLGGRVGMYAYVSGIVLVLLLYSSPSIKPSPLTLLSPNSAPDIHALQAARCCCGGKDLRNTC